MTLFAALPMYDWPEIAGATDRYWRHLADCLSSRGLPAPSSLRRDGNPHEDWLSPDCFFSQACGLPYVTDLRGRVCLIGSPAYDVDCGSGSYFSVVITHRDGDHVSFETAAEGHFAYNDHRSQSGFAAFFETLQERSIVRSPHGQMTRSGSHRASIGLVAEGKADIATIDAVSWELAKLHDRNAGRVRVLARTKSVPGLPYITSSAFAHRVEDFRNGVAEAMASLDANSRSDLLLAGFTAREDRAYQPIADLWQMARPIIPAV